MFNLPTLLRNLRGNKVRNNHWQKQNLGRSSKADSIDSVEQILLKQRLGSESLTSFVCFREKSEEVPNQFSIAALAARVIDSRTLPRLNTATFKGRLSYELLKLSQFAIFANLYIQKKLILALRKGAETKDVFVRGLLWKRGKLFRPVTHVGVVTLSVLAVVAGSYINSSRVEAVDVTEEVIRANNIAETTIPEGRPRSEVVSYQVLGGDTLSSIAEKFGISQDTIVWANNLANPNSLAPGDVLKIPPVTGVVHTVKKGEKLEDIARRYHANAQAVVDFPFNDISDNFALREGQTLVIPDGQRPDDPKPASQRNLASSQTRSTAPAPVKTVTGFMWPIKGSITQYSSWYHPGALDIQGPYGTPVYASDSGTVIVSQKLGYGYGWHIVVDHGNGYTTLYGHMSGLNASVGQRVGKGQVIGWEGSTGRSTGPHVHFEIHKNGIAVNPLSILP